MRYRNVLEHAANLPEPRCARVIRDAPVLLCALSLLVHGAWACRPGGESQPKPEPARAPGRGDRVVVEPRAAEFFEGRVLSVSAERLRVEVLAGGEPLSVSRADVYLLSDARGALKVGQFAICMDAASWIGCRVEQVSRDQLGVALLAKGKVTIAKGLALTPSASTELNLKQAFARSAERREFEQSAEHAAGPVSPPGFVPTLHGRVLVRRAGGWYSGVIQELREKFAYVAFAPDSVREQVSRRDLLPEPPYPAQPTRGDFVLVRPASPAEPWRTLRVLGASARDFRVGAPGNDERVVSVRDLVPLGGGPVAPDSSR